jgi:uncharacterized membrane protein
MKRKSSILAGIGSLLLVTSILPKVGFFLGALGFVLVCYGLWEKKEVFKNFLYGSVVNFALSVLGLVFLKFGLRFFGFLSVITGAIVSGFFFKNGFYQLSEDLKSNLFKWSGRLIFWGSLTAVLVIGIFLIWIGWLISSIAFLIYGAESEGDSSNN